MIKDEMSDENPAETPRTVIICPECQTGVLRLRSLTYFTWLNEELVTVPNFPAWVCDICGRREYDTRAITWLNALLNPEAGRRRQAIHRRSRPNRPLPPPAKGDQPS
jgi:YgiT-type zinc finger domain-containing protein